MNSKKELNGKIAAHEFQKIFRVLFLDDHKEKNKSP